MWRRRINFAVVALTTILVAIVLLPMIQRSREAARRMQSTNNLKQIGLGLLNYHSTFDGFPPGGTFDSEGRGFHGWMTIYLPYLEGGTFYNAIQLQEPWDTTRNAGFFLINIPLYEIPSDRPLHHDRKFPLAQYSANAHILAANSFTNTKSIKNPENVFLLGELAGDYVPWGCPYNWRELGSLNSSPPTYGRPTKDGCQFLFVDGRVEFVANEVSQDILRRMSGEDLTGFKANLLNIQRPSSFVVPAEAIRVNWKGTSKE